ncbi:MAG: 2-amino-4-hydroxy-6-hydroxymethyldihydropteridine diphosphokinase [Geminocystis sp.]|nr:2-amino-4-hydroxy-6-hydroxymethyldihydropteridine diphosphokinase [Geminocystis sp.]MDW8463733.1 2-amino-4-hydroxy-6-hydroxymethyldihydropteridine diphosphokinase [Geminocystis sp.]
MTENGSTQAVIALGSNLGDREKTLNQALAILNQTERIRVICHSRWLETKPIGPPQPDYLNGCAIIETTLTPQQLLDTLLTIERRFGRVRKERWGARTLDLDIIFYGELVLDTPRLQIPHPRMRERSFVLIPLVEIAPHWRDPVTKITVEELLARLA